MREYRVLECALKKEDFQLVGMNNTVSLHYVLSVGGRRSLVKLSDRHYRQESLSLVLCFFFD